MDEDLALACAPYRAAEVRETALLVLSDKALQRVLAVWRLVPRKMVGEPLMVEPGDWAALWACVDVDMKALSDMCALPTGHGPAAFGRARALRLIYPDGSLHAYGQMTIQKLFKDAMQG